MTAVELIESWRARLEAERQRVQDAGHDAPVVASQGRLVKTVGGLHLYEFLLPVGAVLAVDLPVSVVPPDEMEPTEGLVLRQVGEAVLLQVNDAIGSSVPSVTLVPDQAGRLSQSAARLKEMVEKADSYNLAPAERLVPLLQSPEPAARAATSSVLTTVWLEDRWSRRQALAGLAVEAIRADKRVLLLSPDHQRSDEAVGVIGRTMKAGGLNHKMWISRYEMPLSPQSDGIDLEELGLEAQIHQFYARSQAEKASLRHKYERFRELTPLLAQKGHKQKDLDEVRALEWRIARQLTDVQVKLKEVETTLAEYRTLTLFQRLGMQAVGKNEESLTQYRTHYQQQISELTKEFTLAQNRVQQLVREAAVPRELRAEFDDLKEEITKLGGIKKVRELLAAEENLNRQAFIQARRLVAATPWRVASDPLFSRARFDVLIADEAPWIAPAPLLAAAGLARQRIILSGDPRDSAAGCWQLKDAALVA
jgi:hypothetical protein